jgi:hypothetical protein
MRQAAYSGGKFQGVMVFGLLCEEWREGLVGDTTELREEVQNDDSRDTTVDLRSTISCQRTNHTVQRSQLP